MSGNFCLITSAVAAAMDVQVPPVGPAENTRFTFCCAEAGLANAASQTAASARAVTVFVTRMSRALLSPVSG